MVVRTSLILAHRLVSARVRSGETSALEEFMVDDGLHAPLGSRRCRLHHVMSWYSMVHVRIVGGLPVLITLLLLVVALVIRTVVT